LAAPRKHEFAGSSAGLPQIGTDCLTGWLGHLEPDGPARFSLTQRRSIDGMSVGRHVLNFQGNHIAPAELAVDREIEHREIARSVLELQFAPN
jgi:hypothetical protein